MSQAGRFIVGATGMPIETLTGDSGGAVGADGAFNVDLLGGDLITSVGVPGSNNITFNLDNGTNGKIIIASTAGSPAYASLTSTGSTITITEGSNTLNIETAGAIARSFPTDSGTATPALGALTVAGGTLISTSGAGSTVTVDLNNGTDGQVIVASTAGSPAYAAITSTGGSLTVSNGSNTIDVSIAAPVSVADGGTGATSLTDHSVIVGSNTSAITALTVGTDGQVLVGDSANDPIFATLSSSDSTIAFTTGAGTLSLQTGSTVAVSFLADDTNSAAPSSGVLTVAGGQDLTTTAAGSTITIATTANAHTTAINGWNGSILEAQAITVTATGGVITFSVQKSGGGNLTVVFSDGFFDWTTAPDTVVLTAGGDDENPQINFVYFLQSTKALTVNTSDFPSAEHAPIATVLCQTAASLETDGAYKVHSWDDHIVDTTDQGHISDINHWIRHQNSTWKNGVAPTLTITPDGGAADTVIFTSTSGEVAQVHDHTFPAFTGTPDIYVVNNFATQFDKVTDLNTQLIDSVNGSMAGKFFSLVIWGVQSENTSDCKLMCNLPGGSYNTSSNLISDPSRFTNFSIPADFVGTGFLIAQLQLRHQAASSGTWTLVNTIDLRGNIPSVVSGGGTVGQTEFADNTFRILDDGDSTSKIAFQASGITTATTRTLTVQDANGTIALSGVANFGTGVQSNTAFAVLCGGTTATNPIQSIASVGTANQVLTSNGAGALPTFQNAATPFTWSVEAGPAKAMAVSEGYFANRAGADLAFTLPATALVGETMEIALMHATGTWSLAQGAGQTCYIGDTNSTTGAGGSLASSSKGDWIEIICRVEDLDFQVNVKSGNITVV